MKTDFVRFRLVHQGNRDLLREVLEYVHPGSVITHDNPEKYGWRTDPISAQVVTDMVNLLCKCAIDPPNGGLDVLSMHEAGRD